MKKDEAKQIMENPLVEAMSQTKAADPRGGKISELPTMEDGMTAEELALQAGRSVDYIRERLKGLLNEGRLEIGRKPSRDLLGRGIWVPCYKMIEPKQ
ncbi:MAG: hypothetical protein Q8N51_17580 [Gammaproteobacteria bacterium]|nr:hypothetical protein [Gammaproteobacteria bacterium]